MAKLIYNAIDGKLNTLISHINISQNIRRALTYMSDNPLEVTTSQIDITNSLIGDKIILDYYDSEIKAEAGCKLYIYFSDGNFTGETFSNIYIGIDIVCNKNYWRLKNKGTHRGNVIMSEIEDMFNFKTVNSIGKIRIEHTTGGHVAGTDYNRYHSDLKIVTTTR